MFKLLIALAVLFCACPASAQRERWVGNCEESSNLPFAPLLQIPLGMDLVPGMYMCAILDHGKCNYIDVFRLFAGSDSRTRPSQTREGSICRNRTGDRNCPDYKRTNNDDIDSFLEFGLGEDYVRVKSRVAPWEIRCTPLTR